MDKINQYTTFTTKYVLITKEEKKLIKQSEIDYEKSIIELENNCKNNPNYIYKIIYK